MSGWRPDSFPPSLTHQTSLEPLLCARHRECSSRAAQLLPGAAGTYSLGWEQTTTKMKANTTFISVGAGQTAAEQDRELGQVAAILHRRTGDAVGGRHTWGAVTRQKVQHVQRPWGREAGLLKGGLEKQAPCEGRKVLSEEGLSLLHQ